MSYIHITQSNEQALAAQGAIDYFNFGHWNVNPNILKFLGIETAMWIGYMLSKQNYFKQKGQLDKEKFFYFTLSNIQKELPISKNTQSKIIKKLKELNLIDIKLKGNPARNYYRFNMTNIGYIIDNMEGIYLDDEDLDNIFNKISSWLKTRQLDSLCSGIKSPELQESLDKDNKNKINKLHDHIHDHIDSSNQSSLTFNSLNGIKRVRTKFNKKQSSNVKKIKDKEAYNLDKAKKIIHDWGDIYGLCKHREDKKTYKDSLSILLSLMDGTYIKKYKLNKYAIDTLDLDKKISNKKWRYREIDRVIKKSYREIRNNPKIKHWRSLSTFLVQNKKYGIPSPFLNSYNMIIKGQLSNFKDDPNPKITDLILTAFNNTDAKFYSNGGKRQLIQKTTIPILDYWKTIPCRQTMGIDPIEEKDMFEEAFERCEVRGYFNGSVYRFVKDYVEWMEKNDIMKININTFNVKSDNPGHPFNRFISHCEEDIGWNFNERRKQ